MISDAISYEMISDAISYEMSNTNDRYNKAQQPL